ncbi:MAG: DNA polymerase I, partial [Defluviitaleaceae bacterium]|nr:DNA polymerase I [Defluviitaleaceae bacterium]
IENAIANAEKITPKRASENLLAHADLARLSKELATIITDGEIDVKIEELGLAEMINPDSIEQFWRLELKSLLKKFGGKIAAAETEGAKPAKARKEPAQGRVLQSKAEVAAFIGGLPNDRPVAYYLACLGNRAEGLAIGTESCNVYIPLRDGDLSHVAAFFEGDFPKIGFNTKKDLHTLRAHGICMKNLVFDLLLAGYLLGNVKDSDDIENVSLEYLNEGLNLQPAAKAQISLFDEETDIVQESANAAFAQVNVVARVYPIMAEMLKGQELDGVFYEIEMPLLFVLADMEKYGIEIDAVFIKGYGDSFTVLIDRLTTEIHELAGAEFNINSTKQLGKVLFEDMGIRSLKKTKTGHSTNVEVLEKLAKDHPIAAKVLEYRSYAKLRSTYVDGLLAAIDKTDGRIHTTFTQATTSTGRLSSVEPNLQNIPVRTRLGRELRRAFMAADGFTFVDADYSQIELRILAELSQDATFLAAFANNQDIHRITAAQVFGVAFEDVTEQMRYMAKAVNFGIVYGISAFSLAEDIKVSVKEAESFIEGYFAKYPQVKQYLDYAVQSAKQAGFAQTIFKRRRLVPELAHKAFVTRSYGERVAMNTPVQGSAADIIKIAMIKVHGRLKQEGLESRLILQVHDELLIETKLGEEERVMAILRDEMENAVSLSVPLAIDINVGKSWYDAK